MRDDDHWNVQQHFLRKEKGCIFYSLERRCYSRGNGVAEVVSMTSINSHTFYKVLLELYTIFRFLPSGNSDIFLKFFYAKIGATQAHFTGQTSTQVN